MKKIIIIISVLLISISGLFARRQHKTLVINPAKHVLDQNRKGAFAWARLTERTKYKVTISGRAFAGREPIKSLIVHFTCNKEDGNAERFLVVKPGDHFYINTGASRPFIMAFLVKFYSNRRTHRGRFIIKCTPVGRSISSMKYNEQDMYRGIRR